MRRALPLLLAACAAAPPHPPRSPAAEQLFRQAEGAVGVADWTAARRHLEHAALLAPDDPAVALLRARIEREAFGEVEAAERIYRALPDGLAHRRLHGLGLCALWRGDEERALRLLSASLEARPTPGCARDLAALRLARGEDASDALDLVEALSGEALRSRLLLAAAGRRPPPARLPEGWSYGVARARLLPLPEAAAEIDAYAARAAATPEARAALRRVLARDYALRRNSASPGGVIEGS